MLNRKTKMTKVELRRKTEQLLNKSRLPEALALLPDPRAVPDEIGVKETQTSAMKERTNEAKQYGEREHFAHAGVTLDPLRRVKDLYVCMYTYI